MNIYEIIALYPRIRVGKELKIGDLAYPVDNSANWNITNECDSYIYLAGNKIGKGELSKRVEIMTNVYNINPIESWPFAAKLASMKDRLWEIVTVKYEGKLYRCSNCFTLDQPPKEDPIDFDEYLYLGERNYPFIDITPQV